MSCATLACLLLISCCRKQSLVASCWKALIRASTVVRFLSTGSLGRSGVSLTGRGAGAGAGPGPELDGGPLRLRRVEEGGCGWPGGGVEEAWRSGGTLDDSEVEEEGDGPQVGLALGGCGGGLGSEMGGAEVGGRAGLETGAPETLEDEALERREDFRRKGGDCDSSPELWEVSSEKWAASPSSSPPCPCLKRCPAAIGLVARLLPMALLLIDSERTGCEGPGW